MANYSDDFDRANGEIGAGWVEDIGDIDIVSNRAEAQTADVWNTARYASTLDGVDHFCEADCMGQPGQNPTSGPLARKDGSTNTYYLGLFSKYDDGSGYVLRKVVGGGETNLDTAASAPGETTIRITVDGATQSMEAATVEVCTDTDSDISTGSSAGVAGYNVRASFNDWSAEDLGAPPAGNAPTGNINGPLMGPLGGPI